MGLIERRPGADRRVRAAVVTAKGEAMTDLVDAAREKLALAAFQDWSAADFDNLVRLMRRFADTLGGLPSAE